MEYVPQVQLNDLDVSGSHLERLVHDLLESPLIGQHFTEVQQALVKENLFSLTKLTLRLKSSLRVCFQTGKVHYQYCLLSEQSGIEQLFNQILRPKLRNFILDMYKDISYVLDEYGYASADYQDLVRKRFVNSWETLIDGYKVCQHLSEHKESSTKL